MIFAKIGEAWYILYRNNPRKCERGGCMGLFSSSKPKEADWMEWHPKSPENIIKKNIYDADKDYFTDFTGAWGWLDFSMFKNILYMIDQMGKNHKELTEKMDKVLTQNQELQKRCEALENEVGIKKR